MRNVFFTAIVFVSIVVSTAAGPNYSHAGVLLDNTSATGGDLAGGVTSFDASVRMGVVFKTNQSVTLGSLTVGLSHSFQTTGTIALYKLASETTNPNSGAGGNRLSSVSTGTLAVQSTPGYVTFSLASMPTLDAGQHYALVLQEFNNTSTGNYVSWHRSSTAVPPSDTSSIDYIGYRYSPNGGVVWYSLSSDEPNSFYLQGTPSGASVPEPTTIALGSIGAGSFALASFFRRRRLKTPLVGS